MAGNKRHEALLNEYKGNIYEFLVAQNLAKAHGVESSFIHNLGQDFYEMLAQQENFIREYYPWLLNNLPFLAQGLAKKLDESIGSKFVNIKIIGKAASSLKEDDYGEGDILAETEGGSRIPISLKLSKAGAFVNTKSAGIKSFLKKYFHFFPDVGHKQSLVGAFFDRHYEQMSYSLQEGAGLEPDGNFENWKSAGFSELPGELSPALRGKFLETLYRVNNMLFETLAEMAQKDKKAFVKCLRPLLGHTREDIFQATTFYNARPQEYVLDSHKVEPGLEAMDQLEFLDIKNRERASSFDILFADRILQIRLKAMNKFTAKGFKVNCAVKSLV